MALLSSAFSDFAPVTDRAGVVRGIWLRRNPRETETLGGTVMFMLIRIGKETDRTVPQESILQALAGQYRIVANAHDAAGGFFVMLDGAPAPGERGEGVATSWEFGAATSAAAVQVTTPGEPEARAQWQSIRDYARLFDRSRLGINYPAGLAFFLGLLATNLIWNSLLLAGLPASQWARLLVAMTVGNALVAVALAAAFVAVSHSFAKPWTLAVVWGLVAMLIRGAAQLSLGNMDPGGLSTTFAMDYLSSNFLWGFCLMAGLTLAVRWRGPRWHSLAVGLLAAWLAERLVTLLVFYRAPPAALFTIHPTDPGALAGRVILAVTLSLGFKRYFAASPAHGIGAAAVGHPQSEALFNAAQDGREDEVDALLASKSPVDATAPNGATPLVIAAQENHLSIVRKLLKAGANVDHQAPNGVSALQMAAQNGHAEVVEQLLASGATVDVQDVEFGQTPLWAAANNGHAAVARLLLRRGAKVDQALKVGMTPLMIAAGRGHADLVRLLLEHGADRSLTRDDGHTAADYARLQGFTEIESLLRGAAH